MPPDDFLVGYQYLQQGKFAEACEAYAEALRLDPDDPRRMADLGRASMAAQRIEEAARLFERALGISPRETKLLHLLAQCYSHLQELQKAEETYRKINLLEPSNEAVKEKIASLAGTPCSVSPGT